MRRLAAVLAVLVVLLAEAAARAQTPTVLITWQTVTQTAVAGDPEAPSLPASVAPLAAGMTGVDLARTGTTFATGTNIYNSRTWTVGGTGAGTTRYVSWGFDTTTPYALTEVSVRVQRNASGPTALQLQRSIDGGAWTVVGDRSVTGTGQTLLTFDLTGITALSSARFRLFGGQASSSTGQLRVRNAAPQNNPAVTGRGIVIRGYDASAVLTATKTASVFSEDGTDCADLTAAPPPGPTPAAIPGACVQFQISVTNAGYLPARNVALNDLLPGALTLAAAARAGWDETASAPDSFSFSASCGMGGCQVLVQNGIVPVGGTATVTIRALVN